MERGKGTFNPRTFLQQAGGKHFRVQTLFGVKCIGILFFVWGKGGKCVMHHNALKRHVWDSGTACQLDY